MEIYLAFNSEPDYSAGTPRFKSAHKTFEGAKKSLFPDKDYNFHQWSHNPKTWEGPDGYGLIRLVEVQE